MSLVDMAKKAWAEEPVIVGAVLSSGVSAGIISQAQASVLVQSVSAVGAAVAQVLIAFGVRTKVSAGTPDPDPVDKAILAVPQDGS